MKAIVLAAVTVFAALGTGCVVARPAGKSSSAASAGKCPPGHQWSDGRCHSTGKGHDPAKH